MANFPPPPPFGGGFFPGQPPFPQQPPIPPPNAYGVNPQFQYMQQQRHQSYGQGPPVHQQHQFNNVAAFNQNQYNVAPSHFAPHQQMPQNFYPFQYPGNVLPPSNGPGLPFAQGPAHAGNFAPMHGNMSIPASGPSQPSTPQLYPSAPHQEQAQRPPPVIPLPNNASAASRLQSGFGNSENRFDPGNSATMASSIGSGKSQPFSILAAPQLHPTSLNAPDVEGNILGNPIHLSHESVQPTSSGIITFHAENFTDPVVRLPGLGATESATNPPEKVTPAQSSRETDPSDQVSWEQRKSEAKDALFELLTGGITYEEIAKEGVELDILRALAPTSFVSRPSRPKPQTAPVEELVQVRQASPSLEPGEISEADDEHAIPIIPSESPPRSKAHDDSAQAAPDSTTTVIGRKDYIARLQAAKQAVVKLPATTPTIAQAAIASPEELGPSQSEATPSESTDPKKSNEARKGEAKDPVKTELVRKRLEALQSARLNQAKNETQTSVAVSTQVVPTSVDQDPATQASRSYSFYADHSEQLVEGLPGLSPVTLSGPVDASPITGAGVALRFSPPIQNHLVAQSEAMEIVPPPDATLGRIESSIGTVQRKRPSASDFIDSPPTRKRRINESDSIQLVIDVSEDEEGEIIPGHSPLDVIDPSSTPARHSKVEASALREKPPLSNFPFESTIPRPPSQVQTPKSLSQLEADIAAEKERLAAIVRNKKLARSESAQGASSHRLDSGDTTPGRLLESDNQLEKSQQLKQQQQRSLTASRQRLQEKLEAERRTHALITARAEQEQREAASAASLTERERRLQRKAALEVSLPKLDAGIESAKKRLEEIRKQQEQLQFEINREMQDRQAVLDEIGALMAIDLDSEPDGDKSEAVADPVETSTSTSEIPAKEPTPSPQSSADLPEVRQPSQDVSSHADDALEDDMDISGSSDEEQEDTAGAEEHDDSIYGESQEPHNDAIIPNGENAKAISSDEGIDATPDEYDPSLQERFSDDDEKIDNDSAEMEDEPELYPDSPQADGSEAFESTPLSDHPMPEQTSATEQAPAFIQREEGPDESNQGNILQEPSASESRESQHDDGEVSDDSAGASNDYEPPEPPQPVDNDALAVAAPKDLVTTEAAPASPSGERHEEALGGIALPQEAEENAAHYTPYESPLHRFHSYRFHPEYVNNVSGGFSSLTFSHNIKTDKTLCRWELAGGICNDPACQYQHFRDLPLTGNKVLLELGSVHEGKTPEEQKQYVDGLRELLASMRDRGLNDIEAVAADIVAYRSRFLNDPTRVITQV